MRKNTRLSTRIHNFNVRVPECGSLGTRLSSGVSLFISKCVELNLNQRQHVVGNDSDSFSMISVFIVHLGMTNSPIGLQ